MIDWRKFAEEWQHYKNRLLAQWDKLTLDDVVEIAGRRDQLALKLQARYGLTAHEAENAITAWEKQAV